MFDIDDLNIAYILGVYLSDGTITPSRSLRLKVIDKDFCENLADACNEVFGYMPKIATNNCSNCTNGIVYVVIINDKNLCDWLENETQCKKVLPSWIYSRSREFKKEFIAAYMDGNGWVKLRERKFKNSDKVHLDAEIGLCGELGKCIDDFDKLLHSLGVNYSYRDQLPKRDGRTKTVRMFRFQIRSFIDNEMYVKLDRKAKQLELIKSSGVGYKIKSRALKTFNDQMPEYSI